MIAVSIVYIVFGMFLDPLGIMLITIPIFVPMFEQLGMDLVWFGVIVVKYLEIGLLTPPVGFNVYVIKTVVGDEISLETIFKGVGWFLACEVIIMTLVDRVPADYAVSAEPDAVGHSIRACRRADPLGTRSSSVALSLRCPAFDQSFDRSSLS